MIRRLRSVCRGSHLYQRTQEARDRIDTERSKLEEQVKDTGLYKRAIETRSALEKRSEEARAQALDWFGLTASDEFNKTKKQLSQARKEIGETKGLVKGLESKIDSLTRKVEKLAADD